MTSLLNLLNLAESPIGSSRSQVVETAPRSKKTQCIEDLRRKVLTEALEPGVYLDETELSEVYGISRPPLREVLRQLAGEGYLVLHENRISRLLDLIFWCEFALVASEYRGAPVIKSLITGKHGMIIPLFLEVKERLEDSHKDLLKLLESRFVRRHNLSDDLADLDQLTFRLEDDKAETMLRVVIACPPGRIPNGCPEHVVYEPIPANIEFNRRKRKVPARIEAQKRIVARRRDEYAAVRDALLMLLRYLEIVTEDEETLAEHPLSTAVEEGFVIPTDSVAFVPMAATP